MGGDVAPIRRAECKQGPSLCLSHAGQTRDVNAGVAPFRTEDTPKGPAGRIRQPDATVEAAAGDDPAVPAQRHPPAPAGMPVERGERPSTLRLPEPHRPIEA